MKIQEIIRNGSKYYHIYLPKNVIENVLHWRGKESLAYQVINESLIIKKEINLSDEWQEHLSCKVCYNPVNPIKIMKNPLRNTYIVVARCPTDQTIIKTTLPATEFHAWKTIILSRIFNCDICNGTLIEERRKFIHSSIGFRVHLRMFCRDCGRHRIKVLAQELWDELHLQDSHPSASHSLPPEPSEDPTTVRCPTCEEPIDLDQSFCGQCGTFIINNPHRK
ncbi:MAG TPA: zinc ribbon domain-containing protein [Candidatus Deferrimicrobium sp.]|nr:zinc ribbon domain-containing protein [Candidatus Deferrimicrobium sp.]